MSSASMIITDDEFHREVEALKSHRRHSVNRPMLDPDLPDLAAIYGGGQELLVSPSAERERRGYDLVDDGQVEAHTPSSFSGTSEHQGLSSARSQFTARRRARGSQRASSSELAHDPNSAQHSSPTSPSDLPGLSPSASSSTSGRQSPGTASSSPKDPSHLFWVPASVHPEISPSDFRNFLREHAARAVSQHAGDEGETHTDDVLPAMASHDSPIAQRLNSVRQQQQEGHDVYSGLVSRATSLSRRGSTLRRQYRPENDVEEMQDNKPPQPLQRNRSGLGVMSNVSDGISDLTISELQRLEAAAEEASQTQNPAMLRSVLRRTLSSSAPSDLDIVDDVPAEPTQDPDAPIIVPKPGQILRRAARTKIRKASGDSTPRGSLASRRRGTTGGELDAASEGGRAWELRRNSAEEMERRHSGQSEISSGAEDSSSAGHSSSRPASAEATDSFADTQSRDSYHSDASQRTSMTSYAETISDSGGQLTSEGQDNELSSPRRTPTQDTIIAQPYHGYFDIEDGSVSQSDSLARSSSAGALVVSPQPSPSEERGSATPTPLSPPLLGPPSEKQRRVLSPPPDTASTSTGFRVERPAPATSLEATNTAVAPLQSQQQQQSAPAYRQKDKDKKGGFGLSWFGLGKDEDEDKMKVDKGVLRKKEKHEKRERKEREKEEKEREESSSSSFLGALFGKKKGQSDGMQGMPYRSMQGQLTAGSLLERNELALQGKTGYYYSRYPIHVERAVYRLSHIKLANPRRPLYEQVLISNLMFWYLSIINRNNEQQAQQQQQPLTIEDKPPAALKDVKSAPSPQSEAPVVDTSSAYDGIEPVYSSSDAEESIPGEQRSQNGVSSSPAPTSVSTAVKQKRTGLVKPNRAPAGSNRGRAETPMKQPGYGMQHRQIDDDFKTKGGPPLNQGPPAGFVVGQVVDAQALQANTPYRIAPESVDRPDQARSSGIDYLGLGSQFVSSEPLWSDSLNIGSDTSSPGGSVDGNPTSQVEAESDLPDYNRWRGSQSSNSTAPAPVGLQRSSSPNKPYRAEAEKERAWLGPRSGPGRVSPNESSGVHGNQPRGEPDYTADTANMNGNARSDRAGQDSHPQGRSLSLGTMQRSGSDPWKSASEGDRRRKISVGSLSHSTSAQSITTKASSPFDPIDEKGRLSSSTSTPVMDGYAQHSYEQRSPNGHVSLPLAPGSSAMLEAARSSQSRRR